MMMIGRLAVAAALLAWGSGAAAQLPELAPGEALLQIEAMGQVTVAPDIASFSVGVTSVGTTAREATDANSRQIAEVIAALRRAGVSSRDLRTRQISVQPRFAQANRPTSFGEQPQISGYVAQNSLAVTTRDLAKVPDIIASAFDAGANNVQGPNFALENQADAVAAARRDAIEKARFEANAYAEGLGMRVSRVLRVSEGQRSFVPTEMVVTGSRLGGYPPPPPPPPPPAPPAPVEAGELVQTLNLSIDFAIVPR